MIDFEAKAMTRLCEELRLLCQMADDCADLVPHTSKTKTMQDMVHAQTRLVRTMVAALQKVYQS